MIPVDDLLSLKIRGNSQAIHQLRDKIKRVSPFDSTVMVLGETGTGKELVARAIHYCSRRAEKPFVPVNCGALSDELFLSELFGHVRGAFTDAKSAKPGLLDQANKGTLFLDEIDSLSLKCQVALLRFLQEQEYRPVGGSQTIESDVRVICASNKDLRGLSKEKLFREDLYFRLDVISIQVPPLRDRKNDALELSRLFLQNFCLQSNIEEKVFSAQVEAWILNYDWPGNVRQLENWVMKSCILSSGQEILITDISSEGDAGMARVEKESLNLGSFNYQKERAVETFEKQYVRGVLKACKGNVTRAAEMAQKDRRVFGRLIKKYGVNREQYC